MTSLQLEKLERVLAQFDRSPRGSGLVMVDADALRALVLDYRVGHPEPEPGQEAAPGEEDQGPWWIEKE